MAQSTWRSISLAFIVALTTAVIGIRSEGALVARYEFEGDLSDSSGNGHTGVFGESAALAADPDRGSVLHIPDLNSYVDIHSVVPVPSFPAETSITLAVWMKRLDQNNNTDPFRYAINLGKNGDSAIATLGVQGETDRIVGYIESDQPGGNVDQVNVFGETAIEDGANSWESWHHLAIVYDRSSDQARTYLDGVLDSTVDISLLDDAYAQTWTQVRIGKGDTASVTAYLDDAVIYNHALTAADIVALAGIPEPTTAVLLAIFGMCNMAQPRFLRRR